MTTAHELFIIQPCVERLREARRVYHLNNPTDRKIWQRIAYFPRIDMGEEPQLKPGFQLMSSEDGDIGMIEGRSDGAG